MQALTEAYNSGMTGTTHPKVKDLAQQLDIGEDCVKPGSRREDKVSEHC